MTYVTADINSIPCAKRYVYEREAYLHFADGMLIYIKKADGLWHLYDQRIQTNI